MTRGPGSGSRISVLNGIRTTLGSLRGFDCLLGDSRDTPVPDPLGTGGGGRARSLYATPPSPPHPAAEHGALPRPPHPPPPQPASPPQRAARDPLPPSPLLAQPAARRQACPPWPADAAGCALHAWPADMQSRRDSHRAPPGRPVSLKIGPQIKSNQIPPPPPPRPSSRPPPNCPPPPSPPPSFDR